ncbi:MAG: DUF1934 domain-containing protein [Clostridia bacterium]|nr:DUF1934 domain-containing protein [Clostridia bacterium]
MNCKIKISTTQTDYKGKSIFDRAADELMITESFSTGDNGETIETTLFGTLEIQGDEVSLKYEEEGEGMSGVFTEVKFTKGSLNEISIVRTGALDAFMYFEGGKRHISVYNTGVMPFEICIYSKSVDNRILENGYLEIVYLVEIKGACAQKTLFKMEIEKV